MAARDPLGTVERARGAGGSPAPLLAALADVSRALAGQPDAIAVPGEQISSGPVRVAEQSGLIVGFAVLLERCAGACELDGLFVEPDWMGTGIGRGLVNDAKRIARERGATRIDVVANPQAGGVRKPDRAVLVELAARPQTGSEI